jgi:hypothetical protein
MENNLRRSNAGENFSIAALVLGIVSIIVAFVPCINVFAIITSLLTIIFAAIGFSKAKGADAPTSLSKTSLILGIVGLIFSIILVLFYGTIYAALALWN